METRLKFTFSFAFFSFSFDDAEIFGNSLYAGPYCGNEHPPIFYSNGNSVNISFTSDEFEDHNLVSSGFQIDFQCQNISIKGKVNRQTCFYLDGHLRDFETVAGIFWQEGQ